MKGEDGSGEEGEGRKGCGRLRAGIWIRESVCYLLLWIGLSYRGRDVFFIFPVLSSLSSPSSCPYYYQAVVAEAFHPVLLIILFPKRHVQQSF